MDNNKLNSILAMLNGRSQFEKNYMLESPENLITAYKSLTGDTLELSDDEFAEVKGSVKSGIYLENPDDIASYLGTYFSGGAGDVSASVALRALSSGSEEVEGIVSEEPSKDLDGDTKDSEEPSKDLEGDTKDPEEPVERNSEIDKKIKNVLKKINTKKTAWKNFWKSNAKMKDLVASHFSEEIIDDETYNLLNDAEKAIVDDYETKLGSAYEVLSSYYDKLPNCDELSASEFLNKVKPEEKKTLTKLFAKQSLFSRLFAGNGKKKEERYKDYLTYKYYQSCKKLIDNEKSLKKKDVKAFKDQTDETQAEYEKIRGGKDPAEVFKDGNHMQGARVSNRIKNGLDRLIEKDAEGFETAESWMNYLNSLDEEKKDIWSSITNDAKVFIEGMEHKNNKAALKRMKKNFNKIAHKARRIAATIGLTVLTGAVVLGGGAFKNNKKSPIAPATPSNSSQLNNQPDNNTYQTPSGHELNIFEDANQTLNAVVKDGSNNGIVADNMNSTKGELVKNNQNNNNDELLLGEENKVLTDIDAEAISKAEGVLAEEATVVPEKEATGVVEDKDSNEEVKSEEAVEVTPEQKNAEEKEVTEVVEDKDSNEEIKSEEAVEVTQEQENLLQMRSILEQIQAHIIESFEPEDVNAYPDKAMFGDLVNIEEGSKIYGDIYSAAKGENGKSSYYGDTEERVVYSIALVNEETGDVVNTYTFEDYERCIADGYTVSSYTLVNQHSLNENPDNLVIEGRFQADDVRLVREVTK